jgi:P-type Ca2+ transporter type 2C
VVELDFLNQAFGTTPLGGWQWLQCVAIASSVLLYSECRKWLARRLGGG